MRLGLLAAARITKLAVVEPAARIAGAEPTVVSAEAVCPVPGIDAKLSAELRWESGVTAGIWCSMIEPLGSPHVRRLDVFGRDGRMHVTNPLTPQSGASLVVETDSGSETFDVDRTATYDHQLAAFRDAVQPDAVQPDAVQPDAVQHGAVAPTTGAEPIANMIVIDDCYRAAGLQPRPSIG